MPRTHRCTNRGFSERTAKADLHCEIVSRMESTTGGQCKDLAMLLKSEPWNVAHYLPIAPMNLFFFWGRAGLPLGSFCETPVASGTR
jgi:hypothetical protein